MNKQIITTKIAEFIELNIKLLDAGGTISSERENLIKYFIQNHTGLPFDNNDPEWCKFLVRYSCVLQEVGKYNRAIISILISCFLLYGIAVASFSFVDLSNSVPILSKTLSKSSFIFLLSYVISYFFVYMLLTVYIIPYIITCYTLRTEVSLIYIISKNIKLAKWQNITAFTLLLIASCYVIIS